MMKFNNLILLTVVVVSTLNGCSAFTPSKGASLGWVSSTARFAKLEPSPPVAPPEPKPPVTAKMTMEELLRDAEEEDDGIYEEPAGKLVPIKKETIEFTAGMLGGAVGFAVGGPWAAAVGAALANYMSKIPETDIGEMVVAVSTTTIEIYNFFAKLDTKYNVLEKTQSNLEATLSDLKAKNADDSTVRKVEIALSTTTSKIQDLNDEYDLVGSTMSGLGFVGEVVENSIKKAGELDSDYQLTNKAMKTIKTAVKKNDANELRP